MCKALTLFFVFMVCIAGCSTTPEYPVKAKLFGENIDTTADSEIAKYYIERYLNGEKSNQHFDVIIDKLNDKYGVGDLNRETLKKISDDTSVDFASIFLATKIMQHPNNRKLQHMFSRYVAQTTNILEIEPTKKNEYLLLFVPGWDYVENGHITGSDLLVPRQLVSELGFENYLAEVPANGSVEDIADYLSQDIVKYNQAGKKIIIVGASSAGPAIHLSLGHLLNQQQTRSIKAWINLGGVLQGSPLIDHFQSWPQSMLFNAVVWFKDWDKEKIMSMSVIPSRERFKQLSISDHILIVNYLPIPLSGQLSQFSEDKYPLLATQGPNDGLTLLTDAMAPNSLTIVAMGSDHFLAEDPNINTKTIALTQTVIAFLETKDAM